MFSSVAERDRKIGKGVVHLSMALEMKCRRMRTPGWRRLSETTTRVGSGEVKLPENKLGSKGMCV